MQNTINKDTKLQWWNYYCKEVAKANDALYAIEKLYSVIELREHAYSPALTLIIDSLTTKVFLTIYQLFDSQDDSLRLTRILEEPADIEEAKRIEKECVPFIETRHKRFAHVSKNGSDTNEHKSNFLLMNKYNSDKLVEIFNDVGVLLRKWGVKNNNGGVVADRWGNIGVSIDLLVESLEEHNYLISNMTTFEKYEKLENMRKNKS